MAANEGARSTRREAERPRPRLRERMRTSWAGLGRTLILRRAAAVLLVLLAGALAARAPTSHAAERTRILVASHDLAAGDVLAAEDTAPRDVPVDQVPDGALRDPTAVQGRALSGASRKGEPITDVRVVEPDVTAQGAAPAVDDEHAVVPVRVADPAVADFLHHGQRVDLVATSASSDSEAADVVAERVPVVADHPSGEREGRGRLILVGVPSGQAATVAAASTAEPLAVTLR